MWEGEGQKCSFKGHPTKQIIHIAHQRLQNKTQQQRIKMRPTDAILQLALLFCMKYRISSSKLMLTKGLRSDRTRLQPFQAMHLACAEI